MTLEVASDEQGRRVVRQTHLAEDGRTVIVEHNYPDALVHHYSSGEPGEPIPLYQGKFDLAAESSTKTWNGHIRLTWYPNPKVVASGVRTADYDDLMRLTADSGQRAWVALPQARLPDVESLPPQPQTVPDIPERPQQPRTLTLTDERLGPQHLGDATNLDRVTLLVPNGWEVHHGRGICDPNDLARTWHGRLEGEGAGWHFTFDRRRSIDRTFWKRLRSENASAVTHIGELRRVDGERFNADEVIEALDSLRLAMSLAVGRTVQPLLPVGWRGGDAVWSRWTSPHIDSVMNTGAFLDRHEGNEQLRELMERVLDYCTTPARKEVLRYATSYYVTATYDVDIELRVALPISGLQLLAYNRFVEERRTHSNTQWRKIPTTEDEIRLLLDDCRVPTALPEVLAYLRAVSDKAYDPQRDAGPRDALGGVMLLRNKIIHPTSSRPGLWTPYEWAEAGTYATYCLLLGILNTVGYTGRHRSPLNPEV